MKNGKIKRLIGLIPGRQFMTQESLNPSKCFIEKSLQDALPSIQGYLYQNQVFLEFILRFHDDYQWYFELGEDFSGIRQVFQNPRSPDRNELVFFQVKRRIDESISLRTDLLHHILAHWVFLWEKHSSKGDCKFFLVTTANRKTGKASVKASSLWMKNSMNGKDLDILRQEILKHCKNLDEVSKKQEEKHKKLILLLENRDNFKRFWSCISWDYFGHPDFEPHQIDLSRLLAQTAPFSWESPSYIPSPDIYTTRITKELIGYLFFIIGNKDYSISRVPLTKKKLLDEVNSVYLSNHNDFEQLASGVISTIINILYSIDERTRRIEDQQRKNHAETMAKFRTLENNLSTNLPLAQADYREPRNPPDVLKNLWPPKR